jgi:uncharacterized membrane protein YjgN (DUF898 family)
MTKPPSSDRTIPLSHDSTSPTPAEAADDDRIRLVFDSTTADYVPIWIVTRLLTLVTLGIYSPWAEIRSERFFCARTRLGDTPFEYRARPFAIFKRTLLTSMLPNALLLSATWFSPIRGVAWAIYLALLPWTTVHNVRFRARNTWHGDRPIEMTASYGAVLQALLAAIVCALFVAGLVETLPLDMRHTRALWISLQLALIFAATIVVGGLARVCVGNALWRRATLGSFRFASDYRLGSELVFFVTQALALLLSCGLLSPWLALRAHRYELRHVWLVPAEPPEPPAPALTTVPDWDRTWA